MNVHTGWNQRMPAKLYLTAINDQNLTKSDRRELKKTRRFRAGPDSAGRLCARHAERPTHRAHDINGQPSRTDS
jgi:hypothetical protein